MSYWLLQPFSSHVLFTFIVRVQTRVRALRSLLDDVFDFRGLPQSSAVWFSLAVWLVGPWWVQRVFCDLLPIVSTRHWAAEAAHLLTIQLSPSCTRRREEESVPTRMRSRGESLLNRRSAGSPPLPLVLNRHSVSTIEPRFGHHVQKVTFVCKPFMHNKTHLF